MDSCWKIISLEAGGVSLVLGYAFANSQYSLLALVPFLILVASFLYMGETLAIINAGDYIRQHIEKSLSGLQGVAVQPNWQSFISSKERRFCYKVIHFSTYLLFAGLFWASIAFMVWLKLDPSLGAIPFSWLTIEVFVIIYSAAFAVNVYVYCSAILTKNY
jgi:hypothetical protein